jgi:RimJ/RimL family protein N-acetyltransferase
LATPEPGPIVGLRPSRPEDDAAQITWVASAEETARFAGPSLTFPITSAQLRAHRDDPAIHALVAFVAPDEITPIGRIDVVDLGDGAGRLSRVLIDPAQRGRGYAGPMISCALTHARAAGLKTLELHVFKDNSPAIRAYERLCFTITGDAPRDARQQTMRLDLNPDDDR